MPSVSDAQDEGSATDGHDKLRADSGGIPDGPSSNPFAAEGELSRKADYILAHSTITRTELHIADPDQPDPEARLESVVRSGVLASAQRPTDMTPSVRENGGQPVEAEVKQIKVSSPEQGTAEQIKLTDDKKPCKCCLIQ